MAPLSFLRPLCTLFIITPLILAHMQMEEPSPLRDPHSKRAAEPKDFNILTPLKGDGSDFSCKGYQWNTPLTPVRTYYAGETYEMRLRGGATHGGGSCQIGLSCDEGRNFKVLKSIIGGCPIQKEYEFTIPEYAVDGLCFLSWTWFNRIGNREMYMNCAVVNIRGAEYKKRMKRREVSGYQDADYEDLGEDDSASVGSAAAQAALSDLPDLYVANLKGVNNCQTKETVDLVFDDPGNDVIYNKGTKRRVRRATGSGRKCTGVAKKKGPGMALAPASTELTWDEAPSSNEPSRSKPVGGNGQWRGGNGNKLDGEDGDDGVSSDDRKWYGGDDNSKIEWGGDSEGSEKSSECNDGQWHPECYGLPAKQTPNDKYAEYHEHIESTKKDTSTVSGTRDPNEVGGDWYWHDPDYEGDVPFYDRQVQTRQTEEDEEEPTEAPEPEAEQQWEGFLVDLENVAENEEEELPEVPIEKQFVPESTASTPSISTTSIASKDTLSTAPTPTLTIKSTSTTTVTMEVPLETDISEPEELDGFDVLVDPVPEADLATEGDRDDDVNLEASAEGLTFEEFITSPLGEDSDLSSELIGEGEGEEEGEYSSLQGLSDDIIAEPLLRQAQRPNPSICEDIEAVTRYVQPDAAWFAEHTPPPSFTGNASPDQCEQPVWNCDGCRSPNRCIKINDCTRSCTRRPSPTQTGTEPENTSSPTQPKPELTTEPEPEPSTESLTPLQPACPLKPYAGDDPNRFLPCKPGTFICKSPIQFYICGQFGGTPEWSYGALRDVAEGMICEPNLVQGAAKRDLIRELSRRQFVPGSDIGMQEEEGGGFDGDDFEYEKGGNGVGGVEDIIAWFGEDANKQLEAVQEESESAAEEAERKRLEQEELKRQWQELEDALAELEAQDETEIEPEIKPEVEVEEAAANEEGVFNDIKDSSSEGTTVSTTSSPTANPLAATSTPSTQKVDQLGEPLKLVDPDSELAKAQDTSVSTSASSTSFPGTTPTTTSSITAPAILPEPSFLPSDDPNAPVSILPISVATTLSIPLPLILGPGPVIPPGIDADWPGPGNLPSTLDSFMEALAKDKIANAGTVIKGVGKAGDVQKRAACGVGGKIEARERLKKTGDWKRQACPPVPSGFYRVDLYVRKP